MIPIFFVTYFILLALLATPLIYAVTTSSLLIPTLFGTEATGYGLTAVTQFFANSNISTNTGLTILLFVIAGDLMSQGSITEKIFNIFAYFLGKKRGFMPILSICTCMFYGAISGSGPATTAAVGAMCFPVLVGLGYEKLFSAAILVMSGCLGMVIPPSVPVTGVSALSGGLDLIALYRINAVVGVLCGLAMIIWCYFYCLRHGNGDQEKINAWVDELRAKGLGKVFSESIWALLTPVIILGSIFSGLADTAQAAALSLLYGIIIACFVYKTIKLNEVIPMLKKSIRDIAPMLLMVGFASVFSGALSALNINAVLSTLVQDTGVSKNMIMLVIMAYMFIMGALGAGSGVTVVIPLAYPLMIAAGLEPFTCCTAVVLMQAVGLTTPPIGLCLFVMTGMAKCNVTELIKPLAPYILIMLLMCLILVFCPGLFAPLVAGGFIPIP